MVSLISESDKASALEFCQGDPIGARVGAYLRAYKTDYDFALFWKQVQDKKITAVLSRTDGDMSICASHDADLDELKEFIKVVGYETVFAHSFVLGAMKFDFDCFDILRFESAQEPKIRADITPDPKELYTLGVCADGEYSEENYLPWLSDFTFRQRRNMLHAVGVKDESGKLISCAATSAEIETDAIISAVATDENHRNRGLAENCVLTLVSNLKRMGKDNIYVMTKTDKLTKYYERLGFAKVGTAAISDAAR